MYLGQRYCIACKEETEHHDMSCDICAEKARKAHDRKRRMDLTALNGLRLEERLSRIEEQLYDLLPRVDHIESKTATY